MRGYFHDPRDMDTYRRMQDDFCSAPEPALLNLWKVHILTMESLGGYDWRTDFQEVQVQSWLLPGKRTCPP